MTRIAFAVLLLLCACEPQHPIDFDAAMNMREVQHVGGADVQPGTIR